LTEQIEQYIRQIKERREDCRGNSEATMARLIAPLFEILGYHKSDSCECRPLMNSGDDRYVKPVGWEFCQNDYPLFVVAARDVNESLVDCGEHLAPKFAATPDVNLVILTNGVNWWFFSDTIRTHVMDIEPFLKWDVLNDKQLPYDFLTLLKKTHFKPKLIRSFAQQQRERNLLSEKVTRLWKGEKVKSWIILFLRGLFGLR
jgi:hypothetical protein